MDDERFERAFTDAFTHMARHVQSVATIERDAIPMHATPPSGQGVEDRGWRPRWRPPWVWVADAAAVIVVLVLFATMLNRPMVGVPAPVATQSVQGGSSFFEFADTSAEKSARVEVSLSPSSDGWTIRVGRKETDVDSTYNYVAPRTVYWSTEVTDRLSLVVIPGLADNVISVDSSDVTQFAYLAGPDVTVAAVQRAKSASGVPGMIWQDFHARLRDSSGGLVASTPLGVPNRDLTVFRDDRLDVWGYIDPANSTRRVFPLSTEPLTSMYRVSATQQDGDLLDATWIGITPAGVSNLMVTMSTPEQDWTDGRLGTTDRYAYLAHADKVKGTQTLVTEVSYTDKSGRHVEFQPRQ